MRFIYRISNNSYKKDRLHHASKEYCFLNFLKNLYTPSDKLYVLADSVNDDLNHFLKKNLPEGGHIFNVNTGSNGASFRLQMSLVNQIPLDEVVFLHEDDYLYKPLNVDNETNKFNRTLIIEGLQKADYVTLYDHPDKYIPPSLGGNPKINENGVEQTGIFLTKNSHWKYTNSTTLTFAAYAKTLIEDMPVWSPYISGAHPHDFQAFLSLGKRGRKIASPIPGRSTHCDPHNLCPLTNWESI
jgi:hypothetical protein